ncbi:MAG: hypothetical protein HFE75_05900 [Firmicutes bacterium]|nr:hypothetical protein [Bacillota bacterium]
MEKKMTLWRVPVACLMAFLMVLGLAASPVFASAPAKERVKYLGSGKVEVDFWNDAEYRNVKVTVKDTSGKKYKASIYDLDDDEIKFKIRKYKSGKTYKFTISGVRAEYTSKFGKVKGTVKIKKASKTKNISASKAKSIALNDAAKRYGVSKSQVYNLYAKKDRDDGVTVYEVEFRTRTHEYEYEISMSGRILKRDRDYDDDRYDRDYDDYYDYD